jgi:hypothetical protein
MIYKFKYVFEVTHQFHSFESISLPYLTHSEGALSQGSKPT